MGEHLLGPPLGEELDHPDGEHLLVLFRRDLLDHPDENISQDLF